MTDDLIYLEMDYGHRFCKMEFKLGEEFEMCAGKTSKVSSSITYVVVGLLRRLM